MDFSAKLDQARTLADVFELVKRAVEAVLGRTRAGLMLALADLGNHPQGFLGAFYPVATNVIVMNKVPLLRIQETNPQLYKPYALRPPPRVPALGRLRRRAGVPRAGASSPRDLVRDRPSRHANLCGHRAVLPEPRVPG